MPKAKPSKEKNVSVSYTVNCSANVLYGKKLCKSRFPKVSVFCVLNHENNHTTKL